MLQINLQCYSNIGKGFSKTSGIINNNDGSPAEVMELVHLQIHPFLQKGFGLQTKMNMNRTVMNM